jgi:GR25 family glycosyltransferase involved in LPS biosynthesis
MRETTSGGIMNCFYINLATAHQRKINFEHNFKSHCPNDWSLRRLEAFPASDVLNKNIPGRLRPEEKGCFLSHKDSLRQGIDTNNLFMVCEDDALFGATTFRILGPLLSKPAPSITQWDILFTDVGMTDISAMIHLIQLKQKVFRNGSLEIVDLRGFPFIGAASYILTNSGAKKILAAIDKEAELNVPFDLFLRNLIQNGTIRGGVFMPFLTSITEDSDLSQIQEHSTKRTDFVWSLFRKIFWVEGRLVLHQAAIDEIYKTTPLEWRAYGTIFAALMDPDLPKK